MCKFCIPPVLTGKCCPKHVSPLRTLEGPYRDSSLLSHQSRVVLCVFTGHMVALGPSFKGGILWFYR